MRLYRISALLLKYWYMTFNKLDRIFDITYWPLIGIIVFGFTTSYIKSKADLPHIMVYMIGGMLIWILFQRVQQDVVIYLLEDFWSGNIGNTFVTPVTNGEIFVALAITGLCRAIFSFTLMTVVAYVAYSFGIFNAGILPLVYVIPLFIFAWGMGILIAGMIFRHGTQIQVFAWSINFLFQPLAGVYYPLETLPVILQKIAFIIPISHVFEGFRSTYFGNFDLGQFIIALGLAFIYFIIGYLFFVSSVKKARKIGMLTKH